MIWVVWGEAVKQNLVTSNPLLPLTHHFYWRSWGPSSWVVPSPFLPTLMVGLVQAAAKRDFSENELSWKLKIDGLCSKLQPSTLVFMLSFGKLRIAIQHFPNRLHRSCKRLIFQPVQPLSVVSHVDTLLGCCQASDGSLGSGLDRDRDRDWTTLWMVVW